MCVLCEWWVEKYSTPHRIRKTLSSFVYILNQTSRSIFSCIPVFLSLSLCLFFPRPLLFLHGYFVLLLLPPHLKHEIHLSKAPQSKERENSANCNSIDNRKWVVKSAMCTNMERARVWARPENKNQTFNQKFINMVFMPWRLSVQILQQTPDTFIPFNRSLHTQIVCTIESKPNGESVFFLMVSWSTNTFTHSH